MGALPGHPWPRQLGPPGHSHGVARRAGRLPGGRGASCGCGAAFGRCSRRGSTGGAAAARPAAAAAGVAVRVTGLQRGPRPLQPIIGDQPPQ
jgi:hypothetical protein